MKSQGAADRALGQAEGGTSGLQAGWLQCTLATTSSLGLNFPKVSTLDKTVSKDGRAGKDVSMGYVPLCLKQDSLQPLPSTQRICSSPLTCLLVYCLSPQLHCRLHLEKDPVCRLPWHLHSSAPRSLACGRHLIHLGRLPGRLAS